MKIVEVTKEGIKIDPESNEHGTFLTPIKAFEFIKELQNALFTWRTLSNKRIDEGKPS